MRNPSTSEQAGACAAEWADLMRAAIDGDGAAYHRLLRELTPALRNFVRRGLVKVGAPPGEAEDIVQEAMLAIHLKRHTWDPSAPIGPWVHAIARNKMIDALRRRGRRVELPIDDVEHMLVAEVESPERAATDLDRHVDGLPERQRAVVRAISIDGASIAEAAQKLSMTEGAVRVALHRGLKTLAATHGSERES